jgi:membrane protease YdiL (CAAX protease family)
MQATTSEKETRLTRGMIFVLYLIGGLAVFLYGANTFSIFPTNSNPLFEWGLTAFFLALALLLRRSSNLRRFWQIAYALFVAAFANAVNLALGNWLGRIIPSTSLAQEYAIDKVSQAVPIVLAIILLTLLAGDDLGSIFLKKGNLKLGLTFGFISFGVFAVIFTVIAVLQSNAPTTGGLFASGVSLETLTAAMPWMLIFVFVNGFMEELWFRGISLGKLRPVLGVGLTVIVTALVFGITHTAGTYISPAERILFPAIVVGLGLVNGFMMLKTDSIWGSVLFHAGYDLLVIIPILVSI